MPFYTVISDIKTEHGYTHLTQHDDHSPAHAVSAHLGQLPPDVGDEDLSELVQRYLDPSKVKLHVAGNSVWAWLEAAQSPQPIATYVVETAVPKNA
jgi:hypothetical protein